MIIGAARSHKPARAERWLSAEVLCQLALPRVRQYACSTAANEYRPVIMPFTPEATVATGSLHTGGVVGVSVCTVLKTLSVVYGIMPIGCCDRRSAQRPAEVS